MQKDPSTYYPSLQLKENSTTTKSETQKSSQTINNNTPNNNNNNNNNNNRTQHSHQTLPLNLKASERQHLDNSVSATEMLQTALSHMVLFRDMAPSTVQYETLMTLHHDYHNRR